MSSGLGGIECDFGAHTDSYLELLVKDAYAVGRVLKFLIELP
jgi:hypothetical protein